MKKRFITLGIIGLAFLVLLAFAGCGNQQNAENNNPAPSNDNQPAEKPALKIGVPLPFTGVNTSLGNNIFRGMEMYFEEQGNKIEGREVQLIKEDTQLKPDVGLQKVRKLVESDQVDLLSGIVSSAVAYAVRDYVDVQKVPLIIACAGAYDLTRSKGSPYIFRTSMASGQYEYPMGPYAVNKLGYKKIVVIAADYAAGHEKMGEFEATLKEAGGTVVQKIWPKLGTNDFGPYLSQINKKADAVFAFFSGSDAIAFVKQYKEFGLKDKIPLIGSGDIVDEAFLKNEGVAALGIITSLQYSPALDTPENKDFVARFKAKYDEVPNVWAEQGYVAAKVIGEALKATKGDTADKEKLLAAIQAVQFEAPQGPFKFSEYRNVIFTTYIRKVEKVNGELQNTIIDSLPNTADRWDGQKK